MGERHRAAEEQGGEGGGMSRKANMSFPFFLQLSIFPTSQQGGVLLQQYQKSGAAHFLPFSTMGPFQQAAFAVSREYFLFSVLMGMQSPGFYSAEDPSTLVAKNTLSI